jgi:hypothetical protein
MKLTASGLRRLIKEEYRRVLRESGSIPLEFNGEPSNEAEAEKLAAQIDELQDKLASLDRRNFDPDLAERISAMIEQLNGLLDEEEEFHHEEISAALTRRDSPSRKRFDSEPDSTLDYHQGQLNKLGNLRRS